MRKSKRQARRRKRIIGGTELRRAFTATPGDTFIVSERLTVANILDGLVWLEHRKYDGSIDHISVPLNQWEKCAQNTLENGAIFRPVL